MTAHFAHCGMLRNAQSIPWRRCATFSSRHARGASRSGRACSDAQHWPVQGGAAAVYVFGGLFTQSFALLFIVVVLLLSLDFWTVKVRCDTCDATRAMRCELLVAWVGSIARLRRVCLRRM